MTQISRKFDFLPGTKIYSNQIDDEFNQLVTSHNELDSKAHEHSNKTILDKITQSGVEASFDLSQMATKGEASSVTAHKSTHATGGSDALTPADIEAEPSIGAKGTAFNKNFGTTAGTIAEGNHVHSQYAPSGYGIGQHLQYVPLDNCEDASLTGMYYVLPAAVDKPSGVQDGALLHLSYSDNWSVQTLYDWRTNRSYTRVESEGVWSAWKGVGGVSYKTYTTSVASTTLAMGAAFDINLVNITGKGYADVLVAFFSGVDFTKNDGVELIVDGQVLWSQANNTSGSTNGTLISNGTPIIGFDYDSSYDTKFDRVYFNSSLRLRAFGTASSTNTCSYGVDRLSYHLEQ